MVVVSKRIAEGQLGFFQENGDIHPDFAFAIPKRDEGLCMDFATLRMGDHIQVTLGNGYTSEGIFAFGEKCSYTSRMEYSFQKTVSYYDGKKKEIVNRVYARFYDDSKVKVIRRAEESEYKMPNKEDILPLMQERLKEVTLKERVAAYQDFCEGYPQYSREWGRLLKKAWQIAILDVTTVEEFESYMKEKTEHGTSSYEPIVRQHLERIFKSNAKKSEQLSCLVWSGVNKIAREEGEFYSSSRFFISNGGMGVLYAHFLEKTKDKKMFFKILDRIGKLHGPMYDWETNYTEIAQTEKVKIWLKK